MQMVQPWCDLGRNYGNNRRNRHFYPHIVHSVDSIDPIDGIERIEDNFLIFDDSEEEVAKALYNASTTWKTEE